LLSSYLPILPRSVGSTLRKAHAYLNDAKHAPDLVAWYRECIAEVQQSATAVPNVEYFLMHMVDECPLPEFINREIFQNIFEALHIPLDETNYYATQSFVKELMKATRARQQDASAKRLLL